MSSPLTKKNELYLALQAQHGHTLEYKAGESSRTGDTSLSYTCTPVSIPSLFFLLTSTAMPYQHPHPQLITNNPPFLHQRFQIPP